MIAVLTKGTCVGERGLKGALGKACWPTPPPLLTS